MFVMKIRVDQAIRAVPGAGPDRNQRGDVTELEKRISKMMEMASDLENPAPALREVHRLDRARNALLWETMHLETTYTAALIASDSSNNMISYFPKKGLY
jgi:hypothetical protein